MSESQKPLQILDIFNTQNFITNKDYVTYKAQGLITAPNGLKFGDGSYLNGDFYSVNGTLVLDVGTDGTDATFNGDVNGDLYGDIYQVSNGTTIKILDSDAGTFTGDVTGNVTGDLTAGAVTTDSIFVNYNDTIPLVTGREEPWQDEDTNFNTERSLPTTDVAYAGFAPLRAFVDDNENNTLREILHLHRHCNDISTSANAEGGYIGLYVTDSNNGGEMARISWRGDNAQNNEGDGRLSFWTSEDIGDHALEMDIYERMTIVKDGKVGIGTTTPTSLLDVNGSLNVTGATTLATLQVTGDYLPDINSNFKIGTDALANATATNNIGIGDKSLYYLTGGIGVNTAIGYRAGYNYVGGYNNTFIGASAGWEQTNLKGTVTLDSTLITDVSFQNAALSSSLQAAITGSPISGTGITSGSIVSSCTSNTITLSANATANGSNVNLFVNIIYTGYFNSVAIGSHSQITANNQISLGSSSTSVKSNGSFECNDIFFESNDRDTGILYNSNTPDSFDLKAGGINTLNITSTGANVTGALDVTGATTLDSTLDVTGATTLDTLDVTGATTLNSTLDVTGQLNATTVEASTFSTISNGNSGSVLTREIFATEVKFNNTLSNATYNLNTNRITLNTQGFTYETFDLTYAQTSVSTTFTTIQLSFSNRVNAQYVIAIQNNASGNLTIPTSISCSLGGNTPFAFLTNYTSNVTITPGGYGMLNIFFKSTTQVFLSASKYS